MEEAQLPAQRSPRLGKLHRNGQSIGIAVSNVVVLGYIDRLLNNIQAKAALLFMTLCYTPLLYSAKQLACKIQGPPSRPSLE